MKRMREYLVSRKLKKLAVVVSKPVNLSEELSDSKSSKAIALEEYFLTAIELDDIHDLTLEFGLNLDSFQLIYQDLLLLGLGQWINGSYAALATLSNSETLDFYLVASQSKVEKSKIADILLDYWSGDIGKGSLEHLVRT
ncbi:hypothetical protein BZG80_14610 [Salinivibrio sp. MA440]|uniref:hypothetical protein n=1 Tax=Salinivibrio sp. MA440 TaxID=1909456 RepID=UPI0009894028|nr:hypothetical protein [Salinivibrio sp. MA440]OOF01791.1 hypothetical protein BZG80_14610 [Salinivibrio sp. MA440]